MAKEILKPLADIRPDKLVSELSMSHHQIIEIARALSLNCKILILDEPTSALSESESRALFKILHQLKNRGIGIIYISHRMGEVFSECDRVTVLRDGNYLGTYNIKDVDRREIVNKMVGREIDDTYPQKLKDGQLSKEVIFEVEDFTGNKFKNISFKLFKGEVLGIAGLIGSGRSELAQAICGFNQVKKGKVLYKGKEVKLNAPLVSIKNGIVYLTEDRKIDGLFLDLSITQNISAMDVRKVSGKMIISSKLEEKQANRYVNTFNIKSRSINQSLRSLSGGNQQKVLFSKILSVNPKIIFLDEPTRGIDVGAKAEIYKLIRELAGEGIGIIFISSELPEIVGMSDRVIVMHEGEKSGEITGDDINEKKIIHMASGITKN
jgi:ribose transport system ATP-binding protein